MATKKKPRRKPSAPIPELIETGHRLRDARTRARKSLRAVAKALDVAESTVARWERGEQDPAASKLAKLAELYEVSADWLLGIVMPGKMLKMVRGKRNEESP